MIDFSILLCNFVVNVKSSLGYLIHLFMSIFKVTGLYSWLLSCLEPYLAFEYLGKPTLLLVCQLPISDN